MFPSRRTHGGLAAHPHRRRTNNASSVLHWFVYVPNRSMTFHDPLYHARLYCSRTHPVINVVMRTVRGRRSDGPPDPVSPRLTFPLPEQHKMLIPRQGRKKYM